MYLAIFDSDYYSYFAVAEDVETAVKKIMEQYGKNYYGKRPSLKQLAKEDRNIYICKFNASTGIGFDNEWGGIPDKLFDYLDYIRKGTEIPKKYRKTAEGRKTK